MSSYEDPLIGQIEALSRQMKANAYDQTNLAHAAQREADRYLEIANIISDLGQRQAAAADRLAELSTGTDDFPLPRVFASHDGYNARQ